MLPIIKNLINRKPFLLRTAFVLIFPVLIIFPNFRTHVIGQNMGKVEGFVVIRPLDIPGENVTLTMGRLNLKTQTNATGRFVFENVPFGKYEVIAHLNGVADVAKTVAVDESSIELHFDLIISAINENVVVTSTGTEESIFSSYQPVETLSSLQIVQKNTASLGEVLGDESGIAKRSFGPGTSRPVIRGFDGDRVLVLQNGLRIGGVSSQGGAYSEPINVLSVDTIEVVKGATTLLYGGNAIGGVVNVISDTDIYEKGLSGYITGLAGSNNSQYGGNAGVKYGISNFLFWANGGGQKAGDYHTPFAKVENSFARDDTFIGGLGWYSKRGFLSFGYNNDFRRYGLPNELEDEDHLEGIEEEEEEENIDLRLRRQSYIFKGGFHEANSFIENGNFSFQYNDFTQEEIEEEHGEVEIESTFFNKTYVYRATFDQKRYKKLSGTVGFSGFYRDYEVIGGDRISPTIEQNNFSIFALERLDFEKFGFQFGARVERNRYVTIDSDLMNRQFTGASVNFGVRIPVFQSNIIVANYSHSFRAPALEELYNYGPHDDNFAFERGNVKLRREVGDGIDLSFRHNSKWFRGELNMFYYNIKDFVFLAFTGQDDEASNLPIADYSQSDSRFLGTEVKFEALLSQYFTLDTGLDYVNAELTVDGTPLPRIPPLRGRLALSLVCRGFSLRPEVVMVSKQDHVFENEIPTSGYAIANLTGTYAFGQRNVAHIFSFNAYNLTDKLYQNHLSLIKDRAPEIGRGIRFAYTVRFF